MATATQKGSRKAAWTGMNWLRQERRLAIYLRDGLSCCYCGASVEQGAQLSLDHVRCVSRGGGNESGNLVTCCSRCNSARGNRSVAAFAAGVASYLGVDATEIVRHVRNARRRVLDLGAAKSMIARRGSAARVLAEMAG